jgi:hypothetical protein
MKMKKKKKTIKMQVVVMYNHSQYISGPPRSLTGIPLLHNTRPKILCRDKRMKKAGFHNLHSSPNIVRVVRSRRMYGTYNHALHIVKIHTKHQSKYHSKRGNACCLFKSRDTKYFDFFCSCNTRFLTLSETYN